MKKISVKIIVNFLSRIWIVGIGIVLVPQYIRYLGIESFGLVGFYSTLLAALGLLDFGLSAALNRGLTKAIVQNKPAEEIQNMVFTIECIYWLIGICMAACIVFLAPAITSHWVKAEHLPTQTVQQAVMLMGVVIAFQWPISLYNGGLTGLERQIIDNIIMVTMTTLRSAGVILLLWLVSPTVKMFFIWQAIISFLYIITMRFALWKYLPKSLVRPEFSKNELKHILRFAAGMTAIGLTSFFLTQVDKIILSKILTLTQFAYYMLAFTVAGGISVLIAPINISYFPRFTALVTSQNDRELKNIYHEACRLVAAVVFPVGLVLIFFTNDVLLIWTKNLETVKSISLMVQILVIGSVLNSLMVVPYLLMLANGNTKFTFYLNLISAIVMTPMIFLLVHFYSAIGGTFVWLIINTGYIMIAIPLVHRKFMNGQVMRWYINDTLFPLIPPLFTTLILKIIVLNYIYIKINLFVLTMLSMIIATSSLVFLPSVRLWIKQKTNV